ncbi:putative WRKY transcription factor 56 [Capsicum baccatum]|uniref:WRKY transcription factor 56 n=1 Tax=Capsicum baccatum TaxID=33114 RepID=A0A2G2XJM3_CAPBA|nr:putative WRKY transcription factor 56 [Capsicum baccatum]
MQHYNSTIMDSGKEPPPLLSTDLSPANFFMQQPNDQMPMQNNYHSQVGLDCDNIDWAGLLSAGPSINNESIATTSNVSINHRNMNTNMMEGGEQHQQQLLPQQQQHEVCRRDKGRIIKKRKYVPPRIAFHTRSTEDILDDGFKWRKYGQKAVKNSTHPRSYYRCTHHTCNVKKQIQRHSKDTSIVVTTYEGIHNHPCEKLMETLSPILKQLQFLSRF